MLSLHVPTIKEFGVRQAWLADSEMIQEFEDERIAAVKVHQHCGFNPDPEATYTHGRPTRTWRITRP